MESLAKDAINLLPQAHVPQGQLNLAVVGSMHKHHSCQMATSVLRWRTGIPDIMIPHSPFVRYSRLSCPKVIENIFYILMDSKPCDTITHFSLLALGKCPVRLWRLLPQEGVFGILFFENIIF